MTFSINDGQCIQPRLKESLDMFYRRMVSDYPKYLRTDDVKLFCEVCNKQLHAKKTYEVKQHFATAKHKARLEESGLAADEIELELTPKVVKQP